MQIGLKLPDPPPPKEIAKPDEMVIKPTLKSAQHQHKLVENKNKQALQRLKALAKIQGFREEPTKAHQIPIKGNKLSPGTSLSDDAKEGAEAHYLDALRDRLRENWNIPIWLDRQKLNATVEIRIGLSGTLQGLKFVKPSGNAQFDDAVKKTIQLSQPLPDPPQELKTSLVTNGILMGFPL